MWGLHHYGQFEEYEWQVVTGVSAGSINASGAVVFKPDDLEMTQFLSDTWQILTTEDVWQEWGDGKEAALLMHGGLLNDSPLPLFLQKTIAEFPNGY